MKAPYRSPEIRRLQDRARALGVTVEFVDHFAANTSECPTLIPAAGCYLPGRSHIRVAYHGRSKGEIAAILSHELEHAEGKAVGTAYPEYGLRCGNTESRP